MNYLELEFHLPPAPGPRRNVAEQELPREADGARDAQRDLSPSPKSRVWSETLSPTAWVQISWCDLEQVTEPL